jgi:predicted glycoside hydrolase/deacetylase ChbG (UPF0249 family)
MIIINADDWGLSVEATESAACLLQDGRITSVSAMVFMKDSERAAKLALSLGADVGLHLNLCEGFTGANVPERLSRDHEALVAFLNRGKYAQLVYNPRLRGAFARVFEAQLEEFRRLYGAEPTHVDGHRHLHLCANMLINPVIPRGARVRRSFTFDRGEKGLLNRAYRSVVDGRLRSRYTLADYFFSLEQCLAGKGRPLARVADLAKISAVELMTHPVRKAEWTFLNSPECSDIFGAVPKGTYSQLWM